MDRPLREHIRALEERLEALNNQFMKQQRDRATVNQLEAEIRAVNPALTHYRAALEIEQSLLKSPQ
ncbi:MAG: hypothetical protein L0Z53_10095 [Acidobacteriales bacterium]|nr:hypothetical protein [Terriglobales bacterium]